MDSLYTLENGVFSAFVFYAAVILLKMAFMTFLTSFHRLTKKVFAQPEDAKGIDPKVSKVSLNDPDVERARRGHLNDLENIPLFILLGLLYVATNPTLSVAIWHFRLFVGARVVHTIAQQFLQVLMLRSMSFFVGMVVCCSMLFQIITATC